MNQKQAYLSTKHLTLLPLLPEQMLLLRDDPQQLCAALSLIYDDAPKKAAETALIDAQYSKMMADKPFMAFHTIWLMIQVQERHIVGLCYFNGAPTQTGMVELFWSMKSAYQGENYLAEAFPILRAWAFGQKGVCMMLSHPGREDAAAQEQLKALGFARWVEHEHPAGPQVWCCEKPIRPTTRTGIFLGISGGVLLGTLLRWNLLLCGIVGCIIGVLVCALVDGNARRKRVQLLEAELAACGAPGEEDTHE